MVGKASLDLGRSGNAVKRKGRSPSHAPESKRGKRDLRRDDGAKQRKRRREGTALENQQCKKHLRRCHNAKKRKGRCPSQTLERKRCKRDLRRDDSAKQRKRRREGTALENQQCKKHLRRRHNAKKRKGRCPSQTPERKRCKRDLRRDDGAKQNKRRREGTAPENQQCKKDLGQHSGTKKRVRSGSAVPESKRCRLDHSGTSRHKTESQASHRRNTASIVEREVNEEERQPLCVRGDILNGRYEVVAPLGKGGFGLVVECIDHGARDSRHVAVKVTEMTEKISSVTRKEIQVLSDLKASDPSNAYHCVQMLEWFEYRGCVCIVFELLGLSTHDFMRENGCQPFSLDHIRQMAYQICTSVNFLHVNKLIHTDLKPENIVFVRSDYEQEYNPILKCNEQRLRKPDIKIVDFGSAIYDHDFHSPFLYTVPYRAPEVVLGLGWSQPIDVWSIGCTLLEYYIGGTVFPADDNKQHLAMMERVLGPLPEHIINLVGSFERRKYFRKGRLAWNKRSPAGKYVSMCCRPLKELMTCHDSNHEDLFDLIEKMLEYDPAKRITLEEALNHRFFFPLNQGKGPIGEAD